MGLNRQAPAAHLAPRRMTSAIILVGVPARKIFAVHNMGPDNRSKIAIFQTSLDQFESGVKSELVGDEGNQMFFPDDLDQILDALQIMGDWFLDEQMTAFLCRRQSNL